MSKMQIDFEGFDALMKRFNELEKDAKAATEEALTKAHELITEKAAAAVAPPNLPDKGQQSSGRTAASLQRDAKITWNGTVASVDVGFNIKKGGLPSIFMMYGTPRYMKVQALYDAFYGAQTEGEVINAEKEILYKALGE